MNFIVSITHLCLRFLSYLQSHCGVVMVPAKVYPFIVISVFSHGQIQLTLFILVLHSPFKLDRIHSVLSQSSITYSHCLSPSFPSLFSSCSVRYHHLRNSLMSSHLQRSFTFSLYSVFHFFFFKAFSVIYSLAHSHYLLRFPQC